MSKHIVFVLLAILVFAVSCSDDMFGTKEPTDISLSTTLMEYETLADVRGKNLQLSASVKTKDGNTSTDNIVWVDMPTDTSAFKVVSTSKGVLTFQIYKSGTYVLTAGVKYRGEVTKTAQCVVTIKDALVGLNIKEQNTGASESKTLYVGNSLSLSVDYTPSDTSQTDLIWSVDNGDVLAVTEQPNGKAIINAKKVGNAVVTVRSKDNSSIFDKFSVIVQDFGQQMPIRSVSLAMKDGNTVKINDHATLYATVTDGNSNAMSSGKVEFTLSGEDLDKASLQNATSRSVEVYAYKGGSITVNAEYTSNGTTVSASYPITITGDITAMGTSSSYFNVAVNEEQTVVVEYNKDIIESRKGYDFTSIDANYVRVVSLNNDKMVLQALKEGTSKIAIASKCDPNLKAEFTISAKTAVTEADRIHKVTLSQSQINYYPEGSGFANGSLSASVYRRNDKGENVIDNTKTVLWSISDPSVAELTATSGNRVIIKPLKPGKATITARSTDNEAVSASANLTVNGELVSLIAETQSVNLSTEGKVSIPLIAYPDYAIYSAPKAQCSSDVVFAKIEKTDTGYNLCVEATGLPGTANVNVYVDGKVMTSVKANVYIANPVNIRSIKLSSSSFSLKQDSDPVYVEAKALDKDGNEVETEILFKGDENAQSISSVERVGSTNGFYIYPQNAGFADWFFYSDSAQTEARLHLEVGGGAVTETLRLKAQSDSISVIKGDTQEVKLNVLPFGTEFNEEVLWTVKNSAIADVEGSGLTATVTAKSKGSTTIQAESASGLTAIITVNVVEKAQVEDTTIAYVEISGGGSKTHLVKNALNEAITLTATAYKADGTEIKGESFTWRLLGSVAQGISTGQASYTLRTSDFGGYDSPAIVSAISNSNPNASAVFMVFVVAGSTVVDEANPEFLLSCESITLETGASKSVDYVVLPATYSEELNVQVSNDCIEAFIDQNVKSITVTGLKEGNATVTLTNGIKEVTFKVNVVAKAEKVDTSITSLSLNRSYLSYDIANKAPQTVTATVYKNGIASINEKVVWSVSDEELVSLTENGNSVLVSHANKVGTVTITASAANNPAVKASCLVEIIDSSTITQTLRYVTISESAVELTKGQSMTLTASGQPASLFAAANVVWGTSNDKVATVSKGRVKAVGVGQAVITVSAEGKSAGCLVIVTEDPVVTETPSSIILSENLLLLSQEDMDRTFDITATVMASTGRQITDRSVVWSVEDPNGAIDYNSSYNTITLSPMSSGTATITATMDDVEAQVKVIVAEAYVDKSLSDIVLSYDSLVLGVGSSAEVKATTIPASSEDNLVWELSNSNVSLAKTDSRNVVLKGEKEGSATLKVYSLENPNIKATMAITVKTVVDPNEVTAVKLDKTSIVLDYADKSLTSVKATVYKGGKASEGKVSWEVAKTLSPAIHFQTLDNLAFITKRVDSQTLGLGYITATSVDNTAFSAKVLVQVIDSSNQRDTLVDSMLNSTAISLEEGSTYDFAVRTIPVGLKTDVSWVVSDTDVATIDQNGTLTALKSGVCKVKAIVKYRDQVQYPTCTVTVYAKPEEQESVPSSIRFTKNAVYLSQEKMDECETVTASVFDSAFTEMEGAEVIWSVANPAVAKIETNGNEVKIYPLSAGKTTVKASYRNISNTITVIVGAKSEVLVDKVANIVFESDSIVLAKGNSKTVKASIIPAGIDDSVSYSISDSEIVEIKANDDNTVTVTAKQTGTAVLTATSVADPTLQAQMTIKVLETTENVVTAIKLDKNYITLALDEKALTELKTTVYVNDKATKNVKVTWSLEGLDDSQLLYTPSDSYASSVFLTKKAAGSGYIVAQAGDVCARCYVEIVESSVVDGLKDIVLSDTKLVLRRNQSYTVRTTMVPDNIVTDIEWTTSDNTIATVNSNGTITAVKEGNAVITAHSYKYDVHKEVQVQVLADDIESSKASFIRLSVQTVELSQTDNKTKDVVATVIATDGQPISGATVSWTMDKEDVASMKVDGNTVTLGALNTGKTTLRAYYGNLSASASVYTGMVPGEDIKTLDHVVLEPSVLTIQTGFEGVLNASSYPAGLEIVPSWESENTEIATVKAGEGLTAYVSAVKEGDTTVTVKDKGTEKTAQTKVRVRDDISTVITGVTLDKSSITLDINDPDACVVLNAAVYVANTLNLDEPVVWAFASEDDNEGVIGFIENDAKARSITIKPFAEGKGFLRAFAKNDMAVYAQVYVRVINSKTVARSITELRMENDSITMKKGETRKIKAVTTPEDLPSDIRWVVEEGSDVVSVDVYGNVTAKEAGNAVVKAYLYGNSSLCDTISITVIDPEQTPSVYDIGSITISPSSAILAQDAKLPTAFTATIYDRSGKAINEENVEWDLSGLGDVAEVTKTEGNTIYLLGKNAGRGSLTAKRTSQDGSVVSKTVFIYTGQAPADPEKAALESISFNTSSPVYLVVGDTKRVDVIYRPNDASLKGLSWTLKGDTGFISSKMDDNGITISALAATTSNPEIAATSIAKNAGDWNLSAKIQVKVVENKAELPVVTSIALDKTAIVLNLAEKADVAVTATGYDYEGNKVDNAKISWSLEENAGTNVTLTASTGKSVGINKGSKAGTVMLVASCGDVKAYCSVEIVDAVNFSGISLSSDLVYLSVGSSYKITVSGSPSELFTGASVSKGGDTSAVTVTADSSNKVFTVNAVKAGIARLYFTAKVNGKTYSADAIVYVNNEETLGVSKISFTPSSAYVQIGKSTEYEARLYDAQGNEVFADVAFSITDPKVASITKNGNKVVATGLAEGAATIYAKSGNVEAPAFVSVGKEETQVVTGLTKIIPDMNKISLKKGEVVKINISTVPSDNTDIITGFSNQENVATVSVEDKVATITAVGNGSATLTLVSGSVSATIEVTVTGEAKASYIKLDKTSVSLEQTAGQSVMVTAKVYSTDNTEMAVNIDSWTIDNSNVVSLVYFGNNTVSISPKNSGSTYVRARYENLEASVRVSVTEKQSLATGPTAISMATPSLTLKEGQQETVSVLYQPNGLAESAKGVKWTSSNEKVALVISNGTGETAVVKAIGIGKATLTATAVSSKDVSVTMTVTVVSASSATDIYTIELDKNSVRMNPSTDVTLNATLTKNGEKVDASEVQWSFEKNDANLEFVDTASLAQSYKGSSATIRAKETTGFASIIATYGNASAKAQVEVADLSVVEDSGLRSVIISDKTMLMEVGEKATFKAAVTPAVTGVKYVWTQAEKDGTAIANAEENYLNMISQNGSSITVSALKPGTVVLGLEAILESFPSVKDSVTVQILEKGSTSATFKYSGVKMSASTLNLSQGADASYLTATLVDTSKKETEDSISKWALLNEKGEEVLYWENGLYVYGENSYSEFTELKEANEAFTDINDFSVIGADSRMLRLVPGKSGIFFVEAYGPQEGTDESSVRVSARTMLNVSGSISAVTFSSSYIHLIKGATTTVYVSKDPVTAKLESYKWTTGDNLSLSEETDDCVIVTGLELGDEDLVYAATDINGKSVSCTMHITVHDITWGTGGIKQISFPSAFVTLGFPYTAQSYKAEAYYMDGTTATDAEITYRKQISVDGVWTDVEDPASIVVNGKTIATYTEGLDRTITITPVDKGEFRVVAELTNNGQNYSSEMYVSIGGNSNNLTASSSSVVLYTGGSASISLKSDNPAYDSGFYAQILSEVTADGYKIENGVIPATGEKMAEALTIANANAKGVINATDLVLGSKILVTNKTSQIELTELKNNLGLSDAAFIGLDADYTSDSFMRILETFPRTATVRVSTLDGQSSTDIAVTIRRLPEGNAYPISIRLSADKVDLQPPFTQEQNIKATLYDQLGNEAKGTIEWYFYPVGSSYTDMEGDSLRWKLDTSQKNEKEEISAYFNGNTMYYTPKKAGLYRLLVLCKQNPQLSYESTISVAGDVTGISSSVGQNLSVAKNNSAEVSAVFSPVNALARNAVFAIDESLGASTAAKLLDPDVIYSNAFIRVSVGGDTATVTGLTGTTGNDIQRMRILYGKETEDSTKLEDAYRNGYYVKLVGKETFKVVDSNGSVVCDAAGNEITINAYYSIVNITVTVTKALYSFSTQSSRSIDPSVLENGKISFDFTSTATSEDGSSSVSPFSRWDWLECRIVGDDSGLVYASSVPVNADGKSLYEVEKTTDGVKEKVWGWYDSDGAFHEEADHSLYYNYKKEEYSYKENITDTSWSPIILSGGKAYYVDSTYTKKQIAGVTYNDLKAMEENDEASATNFLVKRTAMGLATKAGDYSGALSQDNGGSTYFFKLNNEAISNETLRIQIRLKDSIKYGNPIYTDGIYSNENSFTTYGFDKEAVQINESNLALSIGGRIQNIYTGIVIRENHGSTVSETLTENIEQIKMFEGSSVTLIPTYNPTSTHEKGIVWELQGMSQNGGIVSQDVLDSWITYSELNASQLMITAKAFGSVAENDHRIVYAIARSTADASVYCRYEIDIQTMIKSLTFTSVGQVQTNKNITEGVYSSPVYKNVASDNNQATKSVADIYCFDTIDVSGGGGNIDAYYISYDVTPDYGYDLSVELVDNSVTGSSQVIGTIDTTGIGSDVKAFRFVPTGRIYSEYDENGNGIGSYTVAYGDVKMRVYNSQINYSKEFTIHYSPSNFRLVKNIASLNAETDEVREGDSFFSYGVGQFVPEELTQETQDELYKSWDYLWDSTTKTLQGMECVVLYEPEEGKEGEAIELTFAGVNILSQTDYAGNLQNKTVMQCYADPTSASKYKNGQAVNVNRGEITDKISVTWELIKEKGNVTPSDIVCFEDEDGNNLGTTYSSETANIAKIRALGSGMAYLQYSIEYLLTDSDGKVIKNQKVLEDGSVSEEPQKVKITSGVPVYIISSVDPELMRLVQASLSSYAFLRGINASAIIPERVSRCQIDKWYALSSANSITNVDGEEIEGAIYTGKTIASFTKTGEVGFWVGQTLVLGIDDIGERIKKTTQQSDGNRGIVLALGSDAIGSICTALAYSDSEFTFTNIQSKDYLGDTFWGLKTYKDVNLADLSKVKWVTGLTIDMNKLTENGMSTGIALADLLASSKGDFSNTGVNRISLTGTGSTATGLSKLAIAKESMCSSSSIVLNNVTFSGSSVPVEGVINAFTVTNTNINAVVSQMAGSVNISSNGSFVFSGEATSLALAGSASVTLKDCKIGASIKGDSFTGYLAMTGSSGFAVPTNTYIVLPRVRSVSFSGSLGTSASNAVNTISFAGNTNLTNFSLSSCHITNLTLTGCTNLLSSVQNQWNNWNVRNLTITNTSWGSVNIQNSYMKSLDVSDSQNLTHLYVNTSSGSKNFSTINASGCSLYYANVYINPNDSNGSLALHNNKFGNLSGSWSVESSGARTIYDTTAPESEDRPSDPHDSSRYTQYTYISELQEKDCAICNGTGYVSNGKFLKRACTACDDGVVYYYDVTEYNWVYNTENKLYINGNKITLGWHGQKDYKKSITQYFTSEWSGLENLNTTLYGNGICYYAGFASSSTNGTWVITFYTRTAGTPRCATVVEYYTSSPEGGNKNFEFTGYVSANSKKLMQIGVEDSPGTYSFTLANTEAPSNSTVSFVNSRYKYVGGIPIKKARGPEMYVYPFGK
jgi:uncharacterized protein YjdB